MRTLLARVDKAARSARAVLLTGESGTGKELIARARGPRARQPFVTVDCGSLSPGLVASELFGHERGAFTGAERKHLGAFEQADGGTASSLPRCKPRCWACSGGSASSGWAAPRSWRSTCGWCRPRTAIYGRR